jgi:glycosyltransferase involved in cell wall biosynthesis
MIAIFTQVTLRLAAPGVVPKGFTTIILVILFIGGIQLLCLAIIGSYLAHIYDEVKRRPAYIVSNVINPPGAQDEAGVRVA